LGAPLISHRALEPWFSGQAFPSTIVKSDTAMPVSFVSNWLYQEEHILYKTRLFLDQKSKCSAQPEAALTLNSPIL
jgi:hypothetical protein